MLPHYHSTLPHHHIITACYNITILPHHHITTTRYHIIAACYHITTLPQHVTTSPQHVTTSPHYHSTLPHHHSMLPHYHSTIIISMWPPKVQVQVVAKHTCTLPMWLWMKWHCELVHGWMVYTELAPNSAVHRTCTKQRCQYTTSVDIKTRAIKGYSHSVRVPRDMSAVSVVESREQRYIKTININNICEKK